VKACKRETNGTANQTLEMEVDQKHNEKAFPSHKKARFQLESIRTAYKRNTVKDLDPNKAKIM
jgi:hypothetical protein